jgi:hypothetical protein
MTVRREIAKPRRETVTRSPENLRRTRAGRRGFEGRARRPKARRNSGSAIAAEVFMNNAGYTLSSDRTRRRTMLYETGMLQEAVNGTISLCSSCRSDVCVNRSSLDLGLLPLCLMADHISS